LKTSNASTGFQLLEDVARKGLTVAEVSVLASSTPMVALRPSIVAPAPSTLITAPCTHKSTEFWRLNSSDVHGRYMHMVVDICICGRVRHMVVQTFRDTSNSSSASSFRLASKQFATHLLQHGDDVGAADLGRRI
jgi:hypothetical protein